VDAADAPSQFYTGLVADLYEPLVSHYAKADDYTGFLDRAGTPALELCCGSGLPLIELVERGYAVEGLDASRDMLDRCRSRAAAQGLDVVLHHAEMQSFSLGRTYRSIFLAGASITLLTSDADAAQTLDRIHAHLEPGGWALIPLETLDAARMRDAIGHFREVTSTSGQRLRVGMVGLEVGEDERDLHLRLRYERIGAEAAPEIVERDWRRRWWSQSQFSEMMQGAGFEKVRILRPDGGAVTPEATEFVMLARRPLL
jgi:SAM-dependent methyltransferase